jgi:hypothetical protein
LRICRDVERSTEEREAEQCIARTIQWSSSEEKRRSCGSGSKPWLFALSQEHGEHGGGVRGGGAAGGGGGGGGG